MHGFQWNGTHCSSCPTGCLRCNRRKGCRRAAPGYYLTLNIYNRPNGLVARCHSNCQTCAGKSHVCTSCYPNFRFTGNGCLN